MTALGRDSERSKTNRLRVPWGRRKASKSLSTSAIFPLAQIKINIPKKIKIDVMLIQLSKASDARR